MSRRQNIQVIETTYEFPKRRWKEKHTGRKRSREDETPKRYPIIGCIDLRSSRDDYDRMDGAAKQAGLDFDDWASAALVRAVHRRSRRKRKSL